MANKKGSGLMIVWADIPADKEEDFNKWYNEEHMKELLSVPGVLNAARYEVRSTIASRGVPSCRRRFTNSLFWLPMFAVTRSASPSPSTSPSAMA